MKLQTGLQFFMIGILLFLVVHQKPTDSSYQRGRADQAIEDREAFFKCHREIVSGLNKQLMEVRR